MTDIMDSQAVKAAAAASAANAAQPSAHQPLRTAVVKAAELARAAEERARDKQHAKGKKTARERLDLLFDTGTFEEIGRFQGGNIAGGNACGRHHRLRPGLRPQSGRLRAGLLRQGRHPRHRRRREDLPTDGHGHRPQSADRGHRGLRRRPHPGGRGRPDPVRSHLPQDLRGQRLRAPTEPDSRPLRRRCRLLPGPDGPHHHDP